MSRPFDRFMVANNNGHNLKLSRFTDAEFRALIQGVLPIASQATPRGAFKVGDVPATAEDITFLAPKVSLRTATATIKKMRELGMLEQDDEIAGEWVHDWDKLNPAPKSDPTNSKRQAAYRARNAGSNGTRNGEVTPPVTEGVTGHEVKKVEVEAPLAPHGGDGGVSSGGLPTAPAERPDPSRPKPLKFQGRVVPQPRLVVAYDLLREFNRQAGTSYKPHDTAGAPSESLKRILGALQAHAEITADLGGRMIAAAFRDPFWKDTTPHPGVVFGPGVVERNLQAASAAGRSNNESLAALAERINERATA